MGVNVCIAHWLVLTGSLCLGVGHLGFLLDVHVLVLIFLHPLLLGLGEALWVVLLELLLRGLADLGGADGGERGIRRVLGQQRLEHFPELVFLSTEWKDAEKDHNLRTRVRLRFVLIFHN